MRSFVNANCAVMYDEIFSRLSTLMPEGTELGSDESMCVVIHVGSKFGKITNHMNKAMQFNAWTLYPHKEDETP